MLLVPFGLGSTPFVSYINLSLHFCAFHVKFGDLLSFFFFTHLWRFFFSFHCCPTSCLCFCCSSRTVPQNSLCICLGFGCLAGSGWPQRTNKECKCLQSRYSYSSHEPLNLNCFVSPQFPMASDLSFLFVGIRFNSEYYLTYVIMLNYVLCDYT